MRQAPHVNADGCQLSAELLDLKIRDASLQRRRSGSSLHLNTEQRDLLTNSIMKLACDAATFCLLSAHQAACQVNSFQTQSFAIMNIKAATDIPGEGPIGQIPWRTVIADPAILTVVSSQPVFHGK